MSADEPEQTSAAIAAVKRRKGNWKLRSHTTCTRIVEFLAALEAYEDVLDLSSLFDANFIQKSCEIVSFSIKIRCKIENDAEYLKNEIKL